METPDIIRGCPPRRALMPWGCPLSGRSTFLTRGNETMANHKRTLDLLPFGSGVGASDQTQIPTNHGNRMHHTFVSMARCVKEIPGLGRSMTPEDTGEHDSTRRSHV